MPSIAATLNKLKTTVVRTQTAKIDAKLDKAVTDIVALKSHSGRNGYVELVRSIISKTADVKISGVGGGLFAQGVTPTAFGQGSRVMRYKAYQAIVSQINYAYRALQVLVDNILSPDDITKTALEIRPASFLEGETPVETKVRYVREVVKRIELERKLDGIVRSTLLFGEIFCEIGGAKTALTSQTLLSEAKTYLHRIEEDYQSGAKELISEPIGDDKYCTINLHYGSLSEADGGGDSVGVKDPREKYQKNEKKTPKDSKQREKSREKRLANVKMIFHDPQFVVKLQSAMFPMCFGYLVFPQMMTMPGMAMADEAINNICLAILKSLERKLPQMKDFKDDDELRQIIKSMVANADMNKSIDIRYVAPDKMTHFMRPTTKYYPYGESIFDSCQYTAKVFIALETALAVQRLSRSTEKRKIAIEIGLPRDARKAVEMLKEEFRKRKISLDSFGTVDTIPSMITTFEDVYIPQKDGKPFVDISTFTEGNVDIRSKTDEMKFLRDQLVSSLGVPPSFIGIEENLSNKAALSEENILFARTIVGHQKYLTHQLRELLQKIFDIIDPEEALTIMEQVEVSLPVPRSLQFEREARYMNELTTLVENLERIGIPKEYSKKKYLSQIDWEEVKKYEIEQKIEKTLDPKKRDSDEMGMGGLGPLGGEYGGMGGAGGGQI
jgi:hypothetical protein